MSKIYEAAMELSNVKAENIELRVLLWLTHPCTSKYGDDGELQCNTCAIDFKRDSVGRIKQAITSKRRKAFLAHLLPRLAAREAHELA